LAGRCLVQQETQNGFLTMPELSDIDNRAIREEIGERLRYYYLRANYSELPPCIANPLSRLRELEAGQAPSIVPALEEEFV
jgi:hypothetical protein